jgi:hypothetical protein
MVMVELNGLRIKQQAFRHCVEQLKWNYLLEKEDEGGNDDNDKNNNDVDDKDDDDKENDDYDEINAIQQQQAIKSASTIPSRQETTTI